MAFSNAPQCIGLMNGNPSTDKSSNLSILALNYEYPPIGGGGATAHEAILSEIVRDAGCRVLLITSGTGKQKEELNRQSNFRILRIPVGKRDLRFWRRSEVLRYLLGAWGEAKRELRREHYDICHAFFGIPSGLVAYRLRKRMPYVISLRGSDVPGYNQRFTLDHRLLCPLVRRSWESAAAVVANSEGLRKLAVKAFGDLPIQVIPNGVDTNRFVPKPHSPGDAPVLVTVARLIPRKGVDLLITALGQLQERPWRLLVIGDGPEKPALSTLVMKSGIDNRVEFAGDRDRDWIARTLPECDLFILPSLAEGMSNAALEAMACGLPVLLTDTGGAQELVQNNGEVVPCGDVAALRSALLRMLDTPERWGQWGATSRRIAEGRSWSSVAEQYLNLFRRIVRK